MLSQCSVRDFTFLIHYVANGTNRTFIKCNDLIYCSTTETPKRTADYHVSTRHRHLLILAVTYVEYL